VAARRLGRAGAAPRWGRWASALTFIGLGLATAASGGRTGR